MAIRKKIVKKKAMTFEDLNDSPVFYKVTDQQGSIGSGKTVTFKLPVGVTHYRNFIRFTDGGVASTEAQILNDINKITIKVSADQKIEFTGREAVYLAAFYGAQFDPTFNGTAGTFIQNGVLPINYSREDLIGAVNRNATAYGMRGQTSMQIEIEFIGGALTIDGIEMHTEIKDGTFLGRHIAIRKNSKTLGNIGINEIYDLPIDPTTNMFALHFANADGTAHDITHVEILANRTRILDAPLEEIVQRSRKLGLFNVYDASILSIPFTARKQNKESLPMNMQDLLIRLTTSAANTYNILMERAEREPSRSVA